MDISFDLGDGRDHTAIAWRIDGMFYVCTIPAELGRVTDLREQGGRVLADTEAGVPFIVPIAPEQP